MSTGALKLTIREEVEAAIEDLRRRITESTDDPLLQRELRRRLDRAEQMKQEGNLQAALHGARSIGA